MRQQSVAAPKLGACLAGEKKPQREVWGLKTEEIPRREEKYAFVLGYA